MLSEDSCLSPPPAARGLSLQAALRSIGDELERLRVGQAALSIVPEGIEVQTTTEPPIRHYSWGDLQAHTAAQRARRTGDPAQRAAPAVSTGGSWPGWLRVVGAVLDTQGIRTCEIHGALASAAGDAHLDVRVRGRTILDLPAI